MFKHKEMAIIDVGSNTIRLVIYKVRKNSFHAIVNEKVFARLGYKVFETGVLSSEGCQKTLEALRRFKKIILNRRAQPVSAFATAAVRDSSDGKAFIHKLYQNTGIKITILSGEEEARLTAQGVLANFSQAKGVVADLGGSSLELSRIGIQDHQFAVSLPLGPLAVGYLENKSELEYLEKLISQNLETILSENQRLLSKFPVENLYLVGGAWRALAKLDMAMRDYPLKCLNGYVLTRERVADLAKILFSTFRVETIGNIDINKKRIPYLPWSSILLLKLFTLLNIKQAMISVYGIREGVLSSKMPKSENIDPFFWSEMKQEYPKVSGYENIVEWLEILFPESDFPEQRIRMLRKAIALYGSVFIRPYSNQKAEILSQNILYFPYNDLYHEERTFMAIAIFFCYKGRTLPKEVKVLSESSFQEAKKYGYAVRFIFTLCASSPEILKMFSIKQENNQIILQEKVSHMLSETSVKRFETLCRLLELEPIILRK